MGAFDDPDTEVPNRPGPDDCRATVNTTCDMKTFQACPALVLGSMFLFDPYHTASARPGPPALIQGNTFTASPVPVEPSLTWTGLVQFVHPLAADAALTNTCRFAGLWSFGLTFQTTNRFLALSIETTVNRVSGEPVRPVAIGMSLL